MSIKVKLYSDLREKVSITNHNTGAPSILYIEEDEVSTISEILKKLHIEESEISHIFVNGKYCGPGKKVKSGDQIGIFPKRMALMFVEIAKNISKGLKIDEGETTEDRKFTFEIVRCLGACGLAPVIIVNEDVHKRVKPTKVGEILTQYTNIAKGEMGDERL